MNSSEDWFIQPEPGSIERYRNLLGHFIDEFAKFESHLNLLLAKYIEKHTSLPRSITVFHAYGEVVANQCKASIDMKRTRIVRSLASGIGLENMKKSISRIIDIIHDDFESEKEIIRILSHIGQIQNFRNRIVHNGADPNLTDRKGLFYTSNQYTCNNEDKIEVIVFCLDHMSQMTRDVRVAGELISYALDVWDMRNVEKDAQSLSSEKDTEITAHRKDIRGPWHFNNSELRRISDRSNTPYWQEERKRRKL
jgi:hypothetical protein